MKWINEMNSSRFQLFSGKYIIYFIDLFKSACIKLEWCEDNELRLNQYKANVM